MQRRAKPARETPLPWFDYVLAGHDIRRAPYSVWRRSGAPSWLLVYTVKGRGAFRYPGGSAIAGAGDAVLIGPMEPHDFAAAAPRAWDHFWTYFQARAEWAECVSWPLLGLGVRRLTLPPGAPRARALKLFEQLTRATRKTLSHRVLRATNAIESLLLLFDEFNPQSTQLVFDPQVRRALAFLDRNVAKPFSLKNLTSAAGGGRSRLYKLFSRQVGISPQRLLEHRRLRRAASLLTYSELAVKEIAAQVGFDSQYYFSRRFHKFFALSPSDYRTATHSQTLESA